MRVIDRDLDALTCDACQDDPTRVRRVAKLLPSDENFERASWLLKAIADPVRAKILFALSCEPLYVCELATMLDMTMSAVSHHLKVMMMAGILKARKDGKFVCYYFSVESQAKMLAGLVFALTQPQTSPPQPF